MQNSDTFLAHTVSVSPVRATTFSVLREYMEIAPQKLHAQQSSVLFKVDLSQSMGKLPQQAGHSFGLAWADERTPVAVVGICIGSVYIAAAFNPLDPATRAYLEKLMLSEKYTFAIEFDVAFGSPPSADFDWALLAVPAQVFAEALLETEGMAPVETKKFLDVSTPTMLQWLVDNGHDESVRARVNFRAFTVVAPGERTGIPEVVAMLSDQGTPPRH